MHRHRRGRYKDRISKFLQESVDPDALRDAGGRVKTFIHEKPMMSACIGVAAGFLLGLLIRRGD
jgi:ElaB/YqjD/DUF883 family membrane-anchored ribosome-binding protein